MPEKGFLQFKNENERYLFLVWRKTNLISNTHRNFPVRKCGNEKV